MTSSPPSGNSSPVQGPSQGETSLVNVVVAAMDNRHRYFTYDQTERETHLRGLVADDTTRSALEVVLNSASWNTQTGELDRFQLQALLEVRRHGAGETYHCRFHQCGYKNGESTNAVEHVRGGHFGNRPFLCTKCERAFTRKYDLKSHEKTHSRDEEFDCRYCDANFTRSSNRDRHERSAHADVVTRRTQSP